MSTSSQSIKLKKALYFVPESVEINLNQCCAYQQVHEWKIIQKPSPKKSKKYLKLSIHCKEPLQKTLPYVQSKQTQIQSKQTQWQSKQTQWQSKQTQWQSKQQLQSECMSRQSSQSGFEQVKMDFFSQLKSFNGQSMSSMGSIEQISPILKQKQFGFMSLQKQVERWQIQQDDEHKEFPWQNSQQGEINRFSKYEIRRWSDLERISQVSRVYETTSGLNTLKSSVIIHSQYRY